MPRKITISSGFITRTRSRKGAAPLSKKKSLAVNKAGNSTGIHCAVYGAKIALWQQLINNELVTIPRENRSLYREGWLLVRNCFALIELDAPHTLYLRVTKDKEKREQLLNVLRVARVQATNSPAHY